MKKLILNRRYPQKTYYLYKDNYYSISFSLFKGKMDKLFSQYNKFFQFEEFIEDNKFLHIIRLLDLK